MAQVRVIKTPLPTLRGRLRNVVGTLEVLLGETEKIQELAEPHMGREDPLSPKRGTPNAYDYLLDEVDELEVALQEMRNRLRRWLSRPKARRRAGRPAVSKLAAPRPKTLRRK